jgi:predicted transcriptional regulator
MALRVATPEAAGRSTVVSFELNLDTETVDRCHPAEPLCLAPATSVGEAMRQMRQQDKGAVVICDNGIVIGIFTERDVLKMMAAGESFDAPLAQVMTPDPVVLRARDTVGKAIALMAHGGYRRLPIVDDRGRATGIIKVEAILHYLAEHFPAVIYNLPPEPHHATHEREGA